MRKIIVSIHSTFNGVVTGPADDPTNFVTWAQAGIEDTSEDFSKNFDTVDTIMLGRGTYEDLSTAAVITVDPVLGIRSVQRNLSHPET
jgi:dihydrofolate reductase